MTHHPALFTLHDRHATQQQIRARLKKMLRRATSKKKKVLQYFIEFLDTGGTITVRIPSVDDIHSEIVQKRPIAALLTSNFLAGKKPDFNFHFNVIAGLDTTQVYVNDPLPDSRGGKKKYRIADFLFGVHASSFGDIDNGCFMKIRKRR